MASGLSARPQQSAGVRDGAFCADATHLNGLGIPGRLLAMRRFRCHQQTLQFSEGNYARCSTQLAQPFQRPAKERVWKPLGLGSIPILSLIAFFKRCVQPRYFS